MDKNLKEKTKNYYTTIYYNKKESEIVERRTTMEKKMLQKHINKITKKMK